VLIADDDFRVRSTLERSLRLEGFDVTSVADGASAMAALDHYRPDVMLLDISMPNADGLSVCRMLREQGFDTQILMITRRHAVEDRVNGLDAGADDYLVKPFAVDELLARVRARVRASRLRFKQYEVTEVTPETVRHSDEPAVLRLADIELDLIGRRAVRSGRRLDLSPKEFEVLAFLVRHAGVVLRRAEIYSAVWGDTLSEDSKTLDVIVGYLRRKTESSGEPRLIQTVRGRGYVARLEP